MAFNFLKNPFERLSADNQEKMINQLKDLNENLTGKNGVLSTTALIAGNTGKMVVVLEKIHKSLIEIKNKSTKADKEELEMIGKSSIVLGNGMKTIIESIKKFSEIPSSTVDNFIEGISRIGNAFEELGTKMKAMETASVVLLNMAKGIIYFGLGLLLAGPIYLLALPLAPIVIGVVLGVLWLFDKVLGSKESMERIAEGGKALAWMALGIITFGLALLAAGPIYAAAMSTSLLLVGLVVLGAVGLMYFISKYMQDDISQGIKSLMWLGLGIVVFGIALIAASKVYEYLWNDNQDGLLLVGVVILSALGVMMILSKAGDNIQEGAASLIIMSISIITLAVGLWMFSKMFPANDQNWETLALIGAAVGGLTAALMLMGTMKKNILFGAGALILSSVAIIVLSVGLKMFNGTIKDGFSWEQYGLLMATIGGIGVALGIIGVTPVAIAVALGAGVMMLASASIMVLSSALSTWRKTGFKDNDAKDLQKAITRIPMAFLGLTGDEGFVGAIKQAAKTTAVLAAASINAIMMIGISTSLIAIGKGLSAFKLIGFTNKDADNIKNVIGSVSSAFVSATSDNKDFKWSDVYSGIFAMRNLGRTLKGIADGVQQWANLTISEYEYDEKSGKMVETNRTKLTESDFNNVAYGMNKVISSLAAPLAEVGKADTGSGGGIWSSLFGGKGYVRKGIKALQGVGNVLSGLAGGVKDFANLTISKWELVENSDGTSELKEVSRDNMTETDFTNASNNIETVIGVATRVFAKVGKSESESSGWFSGGYVSKGIAALTGIGNVLSGLAGGVKDFANLTISKWELVENSDGTSELKEVSREKFSETDFTNASNNIETVIGVATRVFAKVGKAESESSGWFSGGYVSKGITALTGIGGIVSDLAQGIRGFARMEFTQHKVKDIDGVPTLVPHKVYKMNAGDIKVAGLNMSRVLSATVDAIIRFSKKYESKTNIVENSLSFIGTINSKVGKLGESMSKLSKGMNKISNFEKFSGNITSFLEAFINPFDPKQHGDIGEITDNFTVFTKDVKRLASASKEMKSIDKSFAGVAKSMGTFKDNVNALNPEILGQTKGLFEAMAIISDSGTAEQILSKYGSTLNETFENLASLLEEFGGKVTQSTEQTSTAIAEQSKSTESLTETLKRQQKQKESAPPAANAQNDNLAIQLDEIATILRGTLRVKNSNNGL